MFLLLRLSFINEICTSAAPAASAPAPRASGKISNCVWWTYAVEGSSFENLVSNLGLTIDVFYRMNPSVKEDCTGLAVGTYYCGSTLNMGMLEDGGDEDIPSTISAPSTSSSHSSTATATATLKPTSSDKPTSTKPGPPGPTQTRIPGDCNKWIKQQDGVSCYGMAASAGIKLEELYKLSPALNGDCSGLWAGYVYCVGTA